MKKQDGLSLQERRKLSLLLVLPLLVLPILTLAFNGMGGGLPATNKAKEVTYQGLNVDLPDVNKTVGKDEGKLAFYERARADSIRRAELAKKDPYASYLSEESLYGSELLPFMPMDEAGYSGSGAAEENERKVYDRLDALTQAMEESRYQEPVRQSGNPVSDSREVLALKQDIAKLEDMMLTMQTRPSDPDPEMEQINEVLQQVLDIQHPDRVRDRLQQRSAENRGQIFQVTPAEQVIPVTLLVATNPGANRTPPDSLDHASTGFYGLAPTADPAENNGAIAAVIHETQSLVSGATIKLRQLQDMYVNGTLIPSGNFLFGTVSLQGERLQANIEYIRYKDMLFPVKLAMFDLDGLLGIHVPGAISRDVSKQGGDQALQSVNMGMLSPSLTMQAASAGIEVGKSLLSKKIRLIRVEVKAGHRVLLRDAKNKN